VVPHRSFETLSERLDGAYGRFFKDGYAFCFYRLVARVLRHYHQNPAGNKIEFIFDSQPEQKKKINALGDEFLENTPRRHRREVAEFV
jgi:hypothetical protein